MDTENVNLEKKRNIGLLITLTACLVGTIITLIAFSREEFHQQTDDWFKELGNQLVEYWNTGYGGILILVCGLIFPIAGVCLLPRLDRLTRRFPLGNVVYSNVKLSFENYPSLRFIPSFLVSTYFIIAAFMRNYDNAASFNPQNYSPFAQHTAGEWLNVIFMTLAIFSILLIVAEGISSAGIWGMILHIPVIILANILFTTLIVVIMFVFNILFGLFVSALLLSIVMPFIWLFFIILVKSK